MATPLGQMRFTALVSSAGNRGSAGVSMEIDVCAFQPDLPEGMSVDGALAVILRCDAHGAALGEIAWQCEWLDAVPACTGPETGEGLDAQGWTGSGRRVMVGTEDKEFLERRLGKSVFDDNADYPITYSGRGLTVRVPSGDLKRLSLQFIVAWNPDPEPEACSCWFAIDVMHDKALAIASGHAAVENGTAPRLVMSST